MAGTPLSTVLTAEPDIRHSVGLPSTTASLTGSRHQPVVLYWLGLAAILVLGSFLRLGPPLRSDFPLYDGGMFYVMIEAIRHSNYVLPTVIPYNGMDIPFAYPPLAFYVAAAIADSFGLSASHVLRVLPSVMAVAVLLAFFALARSVLTSRAAISVALLTFAALPSSFAFLIVGSGLARSFGVFFALLALTGAYALYQSPRRRTLVLVTLLAALTLLSHIEMAWFLAFSLGALLLAFGRNRAGVTNSALIALGTLALTAPWWVLVLQRHGLSPFLAASQLGPLANETRGADNGLLLLALIGVAVAAFAAMVVVPDRRFAFLGWLGLIVTLDTRSLAWLPTVPLALASGAIVGDGILSRLLRKRAADEPTAPFGATPRTSPAVDRATTWLVIGVTVPLLSMLNPDYPNAGSREPAALKGEHRAAMQWASQETSASSRFLVVTGLSLWSSDLISEWFPALADRVSVATPQGSEWLPNGAFARRLGSHEALQECGKTDSVCLEAWADANGESFSHVYVAKMQGGGCCPALDDALRRDPDYAPIYDGPGAAIYERTGSR